jgi:hypothetical protein
LTYKVILFFLCISKHIVMSSVKLKFNFSVVASMRHKCTKMMCGVK